MWAVKELDDAKAFVHCVEQRPVKVLILVFKAGELCFQQRVAPLQGFDLLTQCEQVAGWHADVRRKRMRRL
ncbi:hypothetical protein D3C76_776720 [compost metagenome]